MFRSSLKQSKPIINRDLLRARHIQAHVREMASQASSPIAIYLGSANHTGPFLVPITRYIE